MSNSVAKYLKNLARQRYNDDGFPDTIKEIATYGCASGVVGDLIYHNDIVEFYDKHHDAIWEILVEFADDLRIDPLDVFVSVKESVSSDSLFKQYACWTAVEVEANKLEGFDPSE